MFDQEQCKMDGWRCEVCMDGQWTEVVYVGTDRNGAALVARSESLRPWPALGVRNLQKPKIKRMTEICTVQAGLFWKDWMGSYSVAVPLITNQSGHPVVDHSDAIIEVLEALLEGVPTKNCIRSAIRKIKMERGDLIRRPFD